MFEDKKWDETFKKRLARHYDEMKWLYSELYHNDQPRAMICSVCSCTPTASQETSRA